MRDPTPQQLVIELLRTLDEAIDDTGSWTSNGGVRMMPPAYRLHSYPELEIRLREMREGPWRREWWHVSQRYLWGYTTWLKVPYARTVKGPRPQLPPRAEERIQGETHRIVVGDQVRHVMWVKCYRWSDEANPLMVKAGVLRLVDIMYDGDTQRLSLPKPFLHRMLGIDRGSTDGHAPRAREVEAHAHAEAQVGG